jgi:hypothetical protein
MGIEFEVTADEPLEAVAEIAVGSGLLAEIREDIVNGKRRHADRLNSLACESALSG